MLVNLAFGLIQSCGFGHGNGVSLMFNRDITETLQEFTAKLLHYIKLY